MAAKKKGPPKVRTTYADNPQNRRFKKDGKVYNRVGKPHGSNPSTWPKAKTAPAKTPAAKTSAAKTSAAKTPARTPQDVGAAKARAARNPWSSAAKSSPAPETPKPSKTPKTPGRFVRYAKRTPLSILGFNTAKELLSPQARESTRKKYFEVGGEKEPLAGKGFLEQFGKGMLSMGVKPVSAVMQGLAELGREPEEINIRTPEQIRADMDPEDLARREAMIAAFKARNAAKAAKAAKAPKAPEAPEVSEAPEVPQEPLTGRTLAKAMRVSFEQLQNNPEALRASMSGLRQAAIDAGIADADKFNRVGRKMYADFKKQQEVADTMDPRSPEASAYVKTPGLDALAEMQKREFGTSTALRGSVGGLKDPSRRLGTRAGDARRRARELERRGYRREAGQLRAAAAASGEPRLQSQAYREAVRAEEEEARRRAAARRAAAVRREEEDAAIGRAFTDQMEQT